MVRKSWFHPSHPPTEAPKVTRPRSYRGPEAEA